ncbi:MAG TPA: chromate resistance protein ChrB domain-containing protein, partial [Humidesulfovibrio sp.]|uniref:chromate resistance protein ChrB domain-containing protein n=1 Tax=Humidesulfovibrio sp. TaxID=2910988 RepID=UPI002B62AE99
EFVSFDMPGADFTHRGELVTFETIAADFGIRDVAVRRLMGIVKAIDLASDMLEETGEDGGLPAEARAVKDVLDGLIKISKDDNELLERAMLLFDALAASYTPNTGA